MAGRGIVLGRFAFPLWRENNLMNPRIRTLGLVALLAVLLLGLGLPQPAAAAACTAVCYVDGPDA